ncbi:ABC transporter substrate-binding protein [Asanoa sp. NPDC050611]|uniref:ABC transporter substrate-binding protein n=1 Tax=Asanoa sp. NPDC050611 TaxID=3157098 RepID=UPI0033C04BB3
MRRKSFARTLVAVALAASLASCGGNEAPVESPSLEKVIYLTSFGQFGRDAYAYVAKEKGFFREAGFDVEIKAGTGSGDNIKQVVAGQAQFTPIDLTGGLLAAGGDGKVTGFTMVAAIQQRTMAAIMSLEGYGVGKPADLEGKTVADLPGSVVRNLFPTYAKLANVDVKKVNFVNGTPQTLFGTLAQRKVDAIGQFVVGKPTIEGIAKGKSAVLLPYSDFLPDLYGNALITSSQYAKDNPEKVKKFSAALLKGLETAIGNPDEAAAVLKQNAPTTDLKSAAAELTLMGPFVQGSGVPAGSLDKERIARSIAILEESGQIQAGLTPEQVVSFDLVPGA